MEIGGPSYLHENGVRMAEWTKRERENESECIDRDRTVCFRSEINVACATKHHAGMQLWSTEESVKDQIIRQGELVRTVFG